MNKNAIIGVILVIIIVLGGFFYFNNRTTDNGSGEYVKEEDSTSPQQNMPVIGSTTPETVVRQEVTVTYTDSGFSPAQVEINAGDTVKFVNQSSGKMWVGSAMHPTHMLYSCTVLEKHCPDTANTSFDQCESTLAGTSWSFTFEKVGTWKYHNHANVSAFGTVIIK